MKALLLDAGGTLVFPNFKRIAQELAREGIKVDLKALQRAETQVRFDLDQPEFIRASTDYQRWVQYLENVLKHAGAKKEKVPDAVFHRLKEYHDQHNLWELVPKDVPGALKALGSRWRLGVVSNANGTVRKLLTRLGLAKHFEVIVDSTEEGIEKPDPRLFKVALDKMQISPADTGYVGDIYYVDVEGARKAGLEAYLLDPMGLYRDKAVKRIKNLHELAEL
jgi:HAD superfamily hydrolase (TIGR01549 family)